MEARSTRNDATADQASRLELLEHDVGHGHLDKTLAVARDLSLNDQPVRSYDLRRSAVTAAGIK